MRGPSPGFGAAIKVLLDTKFLPFKVLILSRALDRRSRGSIVAIARTFDHGGVRSNQLTGHFEKLFASLANPRGCNFHSCRKDRMPSTFQLNTIVKYGADHSAATKDLPLPSRQRLR
jgi:hypothetical protein